MTDITGFKNADFASQLHNKALDPDFFQPDERSFSDLLIFINRLSAQLKYFNQENRPMGDWYDFFVSDEIFLLAEIEKFPLSERENARINDMIVFEQLHDRNEKEKLIQRFFQSMMDILSKLDLWYRIASRFNKNKQGTIIENELAAAIEFTGIDTLHQLIGIHAGTKTADQQPFFTLDIESFHGIWQKNVSVDPEDLFAATPGSDQLSSALKQLLVIYKPLYRTLSSLIVRAKSQLRNSLENQSDHQPHIGLLLSFLKLYRYAQQELNLLPERQLSFFLETILRQKKRPAIADRLYGVFEISDERTEVLLPKGTAILAGQDSSGADRIYLTERDTHLNHARIEALHTVFVARNPLIDQNSRYQLVSGIYHQPIHPDQTNPVPFATLGEEQRFLPNAERTMDDAQIGFVLSSNVLRLQGGERDIRITFTFTEQSFHYLTSVLMDIAQRREIKADEAFHAVFAHALDASYTGPEGWVSFPSADMIPPKEWDHRTFTLRLLLSPSLPPVSVYQEEIHQSGLMLRQPAIRIKLRGTDSYHPYSHLHFLELNDISIEVSVSEMKQLILLTNTGAVDDSAPFELLGSTPKKGSYLLIGSDELFSKTLTRLQAGWTFFSLPLGNQSLKEYFAAYPYAMGNGDFKLKVQALTDFSFRPRKGEPVQRVDLFEYEDPEGPVHAARLITDIDLNLLKLQPRPDLTQEDVENYNPRIETGFLRLELDDPETGFGYDVYSSVYNAALSEASEGKRSRNAEPWQLETPADPFTPMADQFFLNYSASTRLIFNGRQAVENSRTDQNTLIHLHPFGNTPVFEQGMAMQKQLIPQFNLEGALYLGIASAQPGSLINMLWEMIPNSKWTYGTGATIRWDYLSREEWLPLGEQHLLFDETNGLIQSGIISIQLPEDISIHHRSMPEGLVWLRAGARHKAELVSQLKQIWCNAASTSFQFPESSGAVHPVSLEAFSAEAVLGDIDGILSVVQPLATQAGRAEESQASFVSRISEYLRHKQRAITTWDIERMLLREFDQLAHVRAFGQYGYEKFVAPGEVIVAALPKVLSSAVFYQPRLNPGELRQMEDYLSSLSSPFAKITVRNPLYEFIWIKAKLVLHSRETGAVLKQLHQDLLRYICPWFYEDPQQAMTMPVVKRSDLFLYLQSRPYISFVTGFSLIHLSIDDQGQYRIQDTAQAGHSADEIVATTPWTLLVPVAGNQIEIIQEAVYASPEPTSIEDMVIGSNLVIGEGFTPGNTGDEPVRDLVPETEKPLPTNYRFTLKL